MSKDKKGLVENVAGLIREISPAHADDFEESFKGKNVSVDDLNKHFRVELAALPVDTIDARECLIGGISEETWLGYFSSHVVNPITKHKVV